MYRLNTGCQYWQTVANTTHNRHETVQSQHCSNTGTSTNPLQSHYKTSIVPIQLTGIVSVSYRYRDVSAEYWLPILGHYYAGVQTVANTTHNRHETVPSQYRSNTGTSTGSVPAHYLNVYWERPKNTFY